MHISRFVRLALVLMSSLGIITLSNLRNSNSADLNPSPHTTTKKLLEPESFSSDAIKIAGVSWLPDYLGGFANNTSPDNETGGKDNEKTCTKYGLQSAQPDASLYDFTTKKNVAVKQDGSSLTCYGNVTCKSKFQYTSANCSGNNVPSGLNCSGRYESCTCKPEFKYNASNCSGEYQLSGTTCGGYYNSCTAKPCSMGGYTDTRNNDVCNTVVYGGRTCYSCRIYTCSEKCTGYSAGISCPKGQTKETCSGCSDYSRCTGSPCPSGVGSCSYGCKTYSSQNGCSDVCVECKPNPCQGYYSCGGTWQYCAGSKCSADSSMCSSYCANDYFPNACSDSSACQGIYRNGYCSGPCEAGCTPTVGKILYSDNSCSFDVLSGKTPVGVIAYVNGSNGFAMALKYGDTFFGCSGSDVSCLTNYSTAPAQDNNGSANTSCLKNQCNNTSLYLTGANYCNGYRPVSSGKGSSGWYLPAIGELTKISANYSTIKTAVNKTGGYTWGAFNLSSSEKNTTHYWGIMLSDGGIYEERKDAIATTTCILSL